MLRVPWVGNTTAAFTALWRYALVAGAGLLLIFGEVSNCHDVAFCIHIHACMPNAAFLGLAVYTFEHQLFQLVGLSYMMVPGAGEVHSV